MKKHIAYLALAAVMAQPALSKEDTQKITAGAYVGAGLTLSRDVGARDFSVTDTLAPETNHFFTFKKGKNSLRPSVHVGYEDVCDGIYYGAELGLDVGSKKTKVSKTEVWDSLIPALGTISYTGRFSQSYAVSLSGKLGFLLDESTAVYVKAGPVLSRFSFKGRADINTPMGLGLRPVINGQGLKYSKAVWGLHMGAGVRHQMDEDWSVSAEYGYRRFKKLSHDFEPAGNEASTVTMKPRQHHVSVTFSYKF